MTRLLRVLPFFAFGVLFIFALYLAGKGDDIGPSFAPWANWLVSAAGLSLGIVLGLLAQRAFSFYRDWRAHRPGAGLRLRLFGLLLMLALPPWILLYGFSLRFLNSAGDSWFSVDIERALDSASAIARDALQDEQVRALETSRRAAESLGLVLDLPGALEQALEDTGALELSVFAQDGLLIATRSADPRFILPVAPSSSERARASENAFSEADGDLKEMTLRVLAPLPGQRVLQARFAPGREWASRAESIERELYAFRQLKYLRSALKTTLMLVLSFVLLLGALVALYLAFAISRRLIAPLMELVAANRRVAAGDYSARVEESGASELTLLARSFNQMTGDLADANSKAQESANLALSERSYLETVLERIRSGVLVVEDERLRSANPAASELLALELAELAGLKLERLADIHPRLAPLITQLLSQSRTEAREWRAEVALESLQGKQLLLMRGARLPNGRGHVVIVDDESDVARTQRESAWAEVARRLAHEIKNPLTPIQLAAERLRRKYLLSLPEAEREVLDRATRTIVAQVESLKTMVNAFSDYARPPQLLMQPVAMFELAKEVAELYASEAQKLSFVFAFESAAEKLRADSGRLRQLLHNLIKNSQEAAEGRPVQIRIAASSIADGPRAWYELLVSDDGPGFPEALRDRLFEPYATSKVKGTGLGLAIVKKIVEEHGGQVRAENPASGGALIRVRLPFHLR